MSQPVLGVLGSVPLGTRDCHSPVSAVWSDEQHTARVGGSCWLGEPQEEPQSERALNSGIFYNETAVTSRSGAQPTCVDPPCGSCCRQELRGPRGPAPPAPAWPALPCLEVLIQCHLLWGAYLVVSVLSFPLILLIHLFSFFFCGFASQPYLFSYVALNHFTLQLLCL